jgi:hypothetical protein
MGWFFVYRVWKVTWETECSSPSDPQSCFTYYRSLWLPIHRPASSIFWAPARMWVYIDIMMWKLELTMLRVYRHTKGMDATSQALFVTHPLKHSMLTNTRLAPATSDAFALRTTMLIAAFHFDRMSENGLQYFHRTYLHHKIQAIQSVNSWIAGGPPRLVTCIIRQVATLCFIEVSTPSEWVEVR